MTERHEQRERGKVQQLLGLAQLLQFLPHKPKNKNPLEQATRTICPLFLLFLIILLYLYFGLYSLQADSSIPKCMRVKEYTQKDLQLDLSGSVLDFLLDFLFLLRKP